MALSIDCPACGEPLEVDDEYRAWKVRCPRCRHEFRPADVAGTADEPGDYPPPPRRSRRRSDTWLSDDEVVARAKALVAGPASWLRVLGVLGVLAGLVGIVGAVAFGMYVAENPAQAKRDMKVQNEEDLIVNVVLIGVCSVFSLVFGGLMTYGAIKMGRLESHGWAVATSVLAIVSILFCTCCLVTGVPLGIWGLVTLTRPDVQAGFDVVARRRDRGYRRSRDAYED
ncbi:MAG: hypothetical protein JWO38_1639 [Gemmataceae bacterium]|nr:hypothetical protein [Gemmataceae bacterium]